MSMEGYVWDIYTWLGWSGEVAEPIGSGVPARAHHFLLALPLPRSNLTRYKYPTHILPLTYFIHLPMKMEPTVSSETSAIRTQTPGNYPKRNKLYLEHDGSLKTGMVVTCLSERYIGVKTTLFRSFPGVREPQSPLQWPLSLRLFLNLCETAAR